MGGFLSVLPIVARRVAANWRLLVAVVVGAVLAAAIMSTTAIYTDAIRDLGLSFAIRERHQDEINLTVRSTSQTGLGADYERSQEYIESNANAWFGSIIKGDPTAIGRSATFYPTAPGEPVNEADQGRDRGHFVFVTNLEPHINVVEGVLPGDAPPATPDAAPAIDVAVGAETARRLGLTVGQELDMNPFWRLELDPIRVRIVGMIEPKDPAEEFWVTQDELFTFNSRNWDTIPMVISRETFFNTVVGYLPSMTSDYTTLVYLDTSGVNSRNAESMRFALEGYTRNLGSNVLRTSVQTALPEVLATYDEKLFFTRIPLLVLVLQIAAIVLYYLFMVSTMLVERQASEIALLKSRGATTFQVMRIYVIEGLAILAFALLLGPPIAAFVVSLLGHTPPFQDLSGGASLQVNLSRQAYYWAAAGAALAFLTLLLPAYQATRQTMVQQRTASARPPKQSAFTRYYLDVVLVIVGGILLYQLDRRGSLVNDDFFGEQSVDPVVLLTPAFFILTVGLVFLRLFPLVLRLLAWAVSKAQGAAVLIGMWQLVRNPVHYSRLVLLLMLATAVGMFSASFGATLDSSYADRANYEAGAEVRIDNMRIVQAAGPDEVNTSLQDQFGAEKVTQVYRMGGSEGDLGGRTSFDILGVEPEALPDVAYFRQDFAGESLGSLMESLGPSLAGEDHGLVLPADARWLGVWVNPIDMRSRFGLGVEVRDASGRYFSYVMGPDEVVEMEPGWTLLVADLSQTLRNNRFRGPGPDINGPYPVAEPIAPLTVTSLSLLSPTRQAAPQGVLQFDDLHTSSAPALPGNLGETRLRPDPERAGGNLPNAQVVAAFDATSDWLVPQGALPTPLNDLTRTQSDGTFTALELSWQPQEGRLDTHALIPNKGERVLPVIASEGFLRSSGLQVGDVTQIFVNSLFIQAQIVESFDLFPTLGDSRREPALVTNGSMLAALLNSNPRGPLIYANEAWIDAGDDGLAEIRSQVESGTLSGTVVSVADIQAVQESDPLVAAGWEGILFISFAAILLLSAIGFLIYSYLTAQRRTLEFAVLRTMGFSKKQIAAVVAFEQLFVIGLGMAAGTLMGMRLGSLMIRYMGLTETGDEVLPPLQLEINWLTIGSAWLVLAAVFIVTIATVVLLYSRLALHRVLRIGEA
jgi:ABC-type antimicrobial peptide transport system permease subunit